jgi:hypothetical protein
MPDPKITPEPDRQTPPRPSEVPAGSRPGQDIPEPPNRGGQLGNDVVTGPDGLDIGPE